MSEEKKAQLGAGDVSLVLDGETVYLKPSYFAARTISQQTGGIQGAIERVLRVDMDAIVTVVTLGLGYGQQKPAPKDLAEKIWRAGLTDDTGRVVERAILYLRVLMGGGRMPADEDDEVVASEDHPTETE